jgi:hypothetical protein
VSGFSEVKRIETAIKNKNAKELEWSLWYCRMRQAVPSARPADVKYWSGIEALVEGDDDAAGGGESLSGTEEEAKAWPRVRAGRGRARDGRILTKANER